MNKIVSQFHDSTRFWICSTFFCNVEIACNATRSCVFYKKFRDIGKLWLYFPVDNNRCPNRCPFPHPGSSVTPLSVDVEFVNTSCTFPRVLLTFCENMKKKKKERNYSRTLLDQERPARSHETRQISVKFEETKARYDRRENETRIQ